MDWPANPFWNYALDLYRREGVEGACLELQERHDLDVNLVLLCCWLATRGVEVERDWLARTGAIVDRWQAEVVRPLRAVRGRLKAELVKPPAGSIPERWPELTAGLRRRVLALEIDGERLEQLLLAELAADLVATTTPGIGVASRNLRRYRPFAPPDREALRTLLGAAFPDGAAGDPTDPLDWLEP
ncbi:MAG TPA: TIGR02444 family protein [Geminicoccaceae bacterium]|nr:TIGR02444 family protein [Geminicoccaceae bacterium]